MANPVLLCSDGSEESVSAIEQGHALLAGSAEFEVVMVVDGPDPADLHGASGHAGPVMTEEEFTAEHEAAVAETERALAAKAQRLGLDNAPRRMLQGDPGPAICAYAQQVDATAIVMGSRGRSGLKRAVLGSVSDFVVRNASCPVVVTPQSGVD
ncbi:MAG: universal stress protein [Actinomycetia bacterium]|nr:universal stress protein [Actinomycetes bacterium]